MKKITSLIYALIAMPVSSWGQGLGLPDPDVLEQKLRNDGEIRNELPPSIQLIMPNQNLARCDNTKESRFLELEFYWLIMWLLLIQLRTGLTMLIP